MANGVAKIFPSQSFTIRLVNTSMNIRRLPMWMVLGHALPHATAMAALIEDLEVVKVPGTSTTPQSGSLKDFTAGDYGQEEKKCLRWSMGYKGIRRLYRTARMLKAMPGEKRCSLVTYEVRIVSKY
jgi:hypothetical protein